MHKPKYSRASIQILRNQLEALSELASYDAIETKDGKELKVPKEFALIFKTSAEMITQMLVQLDKAAFGNGSYEQRCEYLEKQLQQTEENLKISLTM